MPVKIPTLEVTNHYSAIYWNEVKCSIQARPGKINYADTEILSSYAFHPSAEDYALEILSVTDEEITFVVPARYNNPRKDSIEAIHPGEEKKFVKTYMDSTTMDGDDISYEVENRLEVRWV